MLRKSFLTVILPRRKWNAVFTIFGIVLVVLLITNWRDFGYVTRPIWDSAGKPWKVIKRFYHHDIPTGDLCRLHGWTVRDQERSSSKVWDATLFNLETDLLEIRLRELWDVVDHFIILEANLTFTGRPKDLIFCSIRDTPAFRWAASKVIYEQVHLTSLAQTTQTPAETAWHNEATMRIRINQVLARYGVRTGDLIVQSDVDEIPARSTIALLLACQGYPDILHLSLRSFMYSFAFSLHQPTTAASVKTYSSMDGWYYSHQRHSDVLLEDAGWHCSFCFRYLHDFREKMTGFSHFDRVTNPKRQLADDEIQRKICQGKDIFDMYPEVYTFRDMVIEFTGSYPETTAFTNMPTWLLQNPERFSFLLPGGCQREKDHPTSNLRCSPGATRQS